MENKNGFAYSPNADTEEFRLLLENQLISSELDPSTFLFLSDSYIQDKSLYLFLSTIDPEKTNLNTAILGNDSVVKITNPTTSNTFEFSLTQVQTMTNDTSTVEAFPIFSSVVNLTETKLLEVSDPSNVDSIMFTMEVTDIGSGKIYIAKPSLELLGTESSDSSSSSNSEINDTIEEVEGWFEKNIKLIGNVIVGLLVILLCCWICGKYRRRKREQ